MVGRWRARLNDLESISGENGAMARTAFVLLLATIPAHLWAAGKDLPFGGPNVWMGGMAVLCAVIFAASRLDATNQPLRVLSSVGPALPIVITGLLLLIWAVTVYLVNDTLVARRVAQMALGIGIVGAVSVCVNTVAKASAVALCIIVATFFSAVFGFGIAFYGDPFLTIWLRLADDAPVESFGVFLSYKRLTGLSSDTITFSYQLAVAIPLAFAYLLFGGSRETERRAVGRDVVAYLITTTMLAALIANSSRSAILGVIIAMCAIMGIYVKTKRRPRRLPIVVVAVAAGLFVLFDSGLNVGSYLFPDEPRIAVDDVDRLRHAPEGSFEWKQAHAYAAITQSARFWGIDERLFRLNDSSTRPRRHMVSTAIRYSLDHPLGTGRYFPTTDHLDAGLDPAIADKVLTTTPHNQFLVILVYYGYPGLALLVAFHLFFLPPARASIGQLLSSPQRNHAFLAPGVFGALAAYIVHSLLHNNGPFVGDWYHFLLIGLLFVLPNMHPQQQPQGVAPVGGSVHGHRP